MKALVWEILAAVIPVAVLTAALVFFLVRRRRRRCRQVLAGAATLKDGISKLRASYSPSCVRPTAGFHSLDRWLSAGGRRRPHQEQPVFCWEDHPTLIVEAAEGGWSKFGFASTTQSADVEWEKTGGSSEFMQAVRLNSASCIATSLPDAIKPKPTTLPSQLTCSGSGSGSGSGPDLTLPFHSTMMDLPLPGPPAEDTSFPREAFFEITILYIEGRRRLARSRARPLEQLRQMFPGSRSEDSVDQHLDSDQVEDSNRLVVLGLTRGGLEENNGVPGTYSGSVGFFSDGSLLLDGATLASKSSSERHWSATNRVIGCGFCPRKKKVIFTSESELLHAVHCSSVAFSNPLFPVLAASLDVMVLVNLGQKPFAYKPANAWRSPNPGFALAAGESLVAGDDRNSVGNVSQELFSLGKVDPWWREKEDARLKRKKKKNGSISNDCEGEEGSMLGDGRSGKFGAESVVLSVDADVDFFEIEIAT